MRIDDEFSKHHTFTPNTNERANTNKRNFEDFLNDQTNFTKKKKEKIDQIVSEKEKNSIGVTSIPKINEVYK